MSSHAKHHNVPIPCQNPTLSMRTSHNRYKHLLLKVLALIKKYYSWKKTFKLSYKINYRFADFMAGWPMADVCLIYWLLVDIWLDGGLAGRLTGELGLYQENVAGKVLHFFLRLAINGHSMHKNMFYSLSLVRVLFSISRFR